MMFKFLLIVVLLFVACGAATILIARLNRIAAQLAELRQQMLRNDERLRVRMEVLQDTAHQTKNDHSKEI